MSLIRMNRLVFVSFRSLIRTPSLTCARSHSSESSEPFAGEVDKPSADPADSAEEISLRSTQILEGLGQNIMGSMRRPKKVDRSKERDRRFPISLQVSLKYMESKAYKETYGDYLIWQPFRRNFGGQFHRPPFTTRVACVGDDGFIKFGQACPICRDEYLVIDYTNVKLISQFVNPHTALVYPSRKTNVCQKKHEELLVAIYKAKLYGTLTTHVPIRLYDYRDYYLPEQLANVRLEEDGDPHQDPGLHRALQQDEFGSHHEYAIENFP